MPSSDKPSRWMPTQNQLSSPDQLERTLRQILQMHYALQDRFEAMQQTQVAKQMRQGGGPVDTTIAGLVVQPIDTQTLADGATLKYDKKSGSFKVT